MPSGTRGKSKCRKDWASRIDSERNALRTVSLRREMPRVPFVSAAPFTVIPSGAGSFARERFCGVEGPRVCRFLAGTCKGIPTSGCPVLNAFFALKTCPEQAKRAEALRSYD